MPDRSLRTTLLALARSIDPGRADALADRLASTLPQNRVEFAAAVLLGTAYPALAPVLERDPDVARAAVTAIASPRDRDALAREVAARTGGADSVTVARELRRFAREQRARIAVRELLPASNGGADVDVTARELSDVADVTIQAALEEAMRATSARFGQPRTAAGARSRFAVIGMGKLGGGELNPGSDVDLVYFYDTDDGSATAPDGTTVELGDFWARVARHLTAVLDEVTEHGFVWRVDLRLRPEGSRGKIAVSLAAAERYYESFGRLWERAAFIRARPVAGDVDFGEELLAMLAPFVWRRRVDPRIAVEMHSLAERARAELSHDPDRDLKLGTGGIRDCEFFVQTLQLVWGGREPRLRAKGTLDGLRRLRSLGFASDRELREIADAYLAQRRAEHAVQTAAGVQTHLCPEDEASLGRIARALGFRDSAAFAADLAKHRKRASARFASLLPAGAAVASRWTEAIAALDRSDRAGFTDALARATAHAPSDAIDDSEALDLARDLFELSQHPDALLGARSRETFPDLADDVLDAVTGSADPVQAARYLRTLFARIRHPGVYVRLLGDDRRAVRRLAEALGASAYLGDIVANQPELGDVVVFARGAPTARAAAAEVAIAVAAATELRAADPDEADDAFVGALRTAKARVSIETALADLSGELWTRDVTLVLSALADAELDAATRWVLGGAPDVEARGLAVLGMGKLGGREIGYGSDLDVIFVFDPAAAPSGVDPQVYFARSARRIIRLVSLPHAAGPGYELDTRLRPSGNQGLLVTSIESFARYHGQRTADDGAPPRPSSVPPSSSSSDRRPGVRSATWERLALLRARPVAGDEALGRRALAIAHATAYGRGDDAREVAREVARLRERMERELSLERPGRHDLKLGPGGLVDVEFCVQFLQMTHGDDASVRTTETPVAIEALAAAGYLESEYATILRDGYAFVRRLEQRIRVVHANAPPLLDERAPGLVPLARRMSLRGRRGAEAAAELVARYRATAARVRAVYEAVVARRAAELPG